MMSLDTPASSLAARDPLDPLTAAAAAATVEATVEKVRSPNVVSVGCCNIDITVRVDSLPRPGETVVGRSIENIFGGKGTNQAVQAALLMERHEYFFETESEQKTEEGRVQLRSKRDGQKVALICKLGDDQFAADYRQYLGKHEIDTTGVLTAQGESTGTALVTVSKDGENTIAYVHGANKSLRPDELLQPSMVSLIQKAKVLLSENGVPPEVTLTALRLAKESQEDVKTIFTPAPVKDVPLEAFAYCDYVILNKSEAIALFGVKPVKKVQDKEGHVFVEVDTVDEEWPTIAGSLVKECPSASALREKLRSIGEKAVPELADNNRGECNVVMTMGAAGCLISREGGDVSVVPRRKVEPQDVVDTVGAGDSFAGAFAYFIGQEGLDLEEAVEKASIVASYSIQKKGASQSYPNRDTLRGVVF